MSSNNFLKSKLGLVFEDLYSNSGLDKLNQEFSQYLQEQNPKLAQIFQNLQNKPLNQQENSEILIHLSQILEKFLFALFDIEQEAELLKNRHYNLQKIYKAKRDFVQRQVARTYNEQDFIQNCQNYDNDQDYGFKILNDLAIPDHDIDDIEVKLAQLILDEKFLETVTNYAIWALYSKKGRKFHRDGALFILPQKLDFDNLVNLKPETINRQNFDLTDEGFGLNRALGEANYCIFCHKQGKDSCRSGLYDKNSEQIKQDPLGIDLNGCPLNEKISEMNLLKSEGWPLAALAIACVDNPLLAGTGHRICNDCMKSCIYQKQDPVDIPQIETRTLKDILALPYGFEIYSLLTRWNPLNIAPKTALDASPKKVLIAGLGPAGYTLAHYLLNEGHEVVAIDGLKIEPLNPEISGIDQYGQPHEFKPIKFIDQIYEPLSKRDISGFGGVVEYGITVRFDKNFLKIIRLLLERRKNFRMFGGIRFGSSITDQTAFQDYGFDHIALCLGAGKPNIINLKNNFAKGIRQASDFLMSLQLTGAFREELFTNLQIRMPIIVIGGGLTAIDTACEAKAYYLMQIRKFAKKVALIGKDKIWQLLNKEEKIIANEFLDHAKAFEKCDDSDALFKKLGGVKILYRKKLQDSPAYRLNHQEVNHALAQDIEFLENITPIEAKIDKFNHITNLICDNNLSFKCGSLLVAAGTTPNIAPTTQDKLDIALDDKLGSKYFKAVAKNSVIAKIDAKTNKSISFLGDLHPNFEGNVVKAMASAKQGYDEISNLLQKVTTKKFDNFLNYINSQFLVNINQINILSDHVFEIFIKAPLLAKHSKIGQIFRLQNYHSLAPKINDQIMAMEGMPVTALNIDIETGIIRGVVVNSGGSTSLIKNFKAGDVCVFMGPSGKPTEIAKNETVILIGGGRGNQVLAAIAKIYKNNGCRVIFFAGYEKNSHIVAQEEMEQSCDQLIYAINERLAIKFSNSKHKSFQGNVIEAICDYFKNNSEKIDRIFTIGNDKMMHEVAKLRHQNIVPQLSKAPIAITSLNAPMQCMLQGVCSQCLQKKHDDNGQVQYFYSCANQDQNMDNLDFEHLHNRCQQNSLAQKISRLWIEFLQK